ncbi:Protein of unknown function [Flavobacteriaceae bacterium MAR_2010_188]|nr:Protein of unknown function [Flavobacteriaceae bacterium MAR_2010_188]
MKKLRILLMLPLILFSCKNEPKQSEDEGHENHMETVDTKEETKKPVLSPHTSAMAMIGDAHVHIDYSSPGVRDRIIFGGLVGYDSVWQAGAHNATWLETNKDLVIDGKTLPAGKYGFFVIPSKGDWTVMINKNWNQHGKDDYDEKDDVLKFKVTPIISDTITEHLEYKVTEVSKTEGSISMSWEKVSISFPFKVKQ